MSMSDCFLQKKENPPKNSSIHPCVINFLMCSVLTDNSNTFSRFMLNTIFFKNVERAVKDIRFITVYLFGTIPHSW